MSDAEFLDEIVLLADPLLLPVLAQTLLVAHPLASPKALMRAKPILNITPVADLDALAARAERPLDRARLLICGTPEIVPQALLDRFAGPSYNLHPGPPERPGRYPSVWALYDGDATFGATLHEAVAEVDAGPIVAVERFAIPVEADRAALDTLSLHSVLRLLVRLTPALVAPAPLAHIDEHWRGRRTRFADFAALCRVPEDADADEFARRYRAVGEGPEHALEITRFGHRFRLDNHREAPVTVGGLVRSS